MQTKPHLVPISRTLSQILFLAIFLSAIGAGSPAIVRALDTGTGARIEAPQSTQAAHYIVFEKHPDGTITPVYYRLVGLAAPLESIADSEMTSALALPSRDVEQIAVSLRNQAGQVVYQNIVQLSPWLRGEFQGKTPGAPIDGHIIPLKTISFVVRVPQILGTTLVLQNERLQTVATFAMEQLASRTPTIRLDPSIELANGTPANGSAGNRENFLVMGDGYTAGQQSQFASDAALVTTEFFSISPYSVYSNYYNIHTLFTASNQSGADHPPYNPACGTNDPTCCSDPEMQSDPLQGTMVDTAFDAQFCTSGIHRLLSTDSSKVFAAAAAVPNWDSIMVLVNDATYGGSGGTIATVSMHPSAPLIAQHEYGHSFVHLADEYADPYPGYPPCSDISGTARCEPNVTDQTVRTKIKWSPWIKSTTPIPTPNDSSYAGLVGLFLGARYQPNGMYRPGFSCIMRYLGAPYCQIPSQAYVLRLYKDISLIEPGSPSPAGRTVHLARPDAQTFHVSVLSPVGGPSVQITWLKNGVAIPGAHTDTYTFKTGASTPALTRITVRVKDVTSLVNPAMAGSALQKLYTWNVYSDVRTLSYQSVALADGWVLESGQDTGLGGTKDNTATTLNVGDDAANRQYRAILSFDTSSLPDNAVIKNATLKLKSQGLVGTDPFTTHGTLWVDIRKPYFGTKAALQPLDFQAAVSSPAVASFTAAPAANWYVALLRSAGFAFINRSGTTQFRLQFAQNNNNDSIADYVAFFSGNAPATYRPQLVIQYYVP